MHFLFYRLGTYNFFKLCSFFFRLGTIFLPTAELIFNPGSTKDKWTTLGIGR